MKIILCSSDMSFLHACRSVLEVWKQYICAEAELSEHTQWQALPAEEENRQSLLILDADRLDADQLPEMEKIRRTYGGVFVCSSDSRKAISLYRLRPTAFLSKPMSASAVDKAMSRCVSLWQNALQSLELTENRSRLKIHVCDILWAEAQGRSSVIHCLSRDIQIGEGMNELSALLPGDSFVRCQRSYMVNLHHVRAIDGKNVYMINGDAVSIGRNARLEVMSSVQRYQEHWSRKIE